MNNRLLRVFISHSLPLLFTALLIGGGAMGITYGFAAGYSEQEARKQLEQIQTYYELILTEMDSLNLMFSTSSEIISRLNQILDADRWELADASDMRMIRSYMSSPANARPFIDSIYVYLNNGKGRVLTSDGGITTVAAMADSEWYGSFLRDGGRSEFRAESALLRKGGEGTSAVRALRIYRTVYNVTYQPIGVIVMNLRTDLLVRDYPLSTLFTRDKAFLVIHDGSGARLISIPGDLDLASGIPPGGYVSISLESRRFGWSYEMGIPRDSLYRLPRIMWIMTVVLSLVILAFGLLLTYKTNQKETRFLENVLRQFEEAGASRIASPVIGNRENVFDYLNSQILKTFLEQDYLRVQKEAMEYRALQMQINPHFLNNALETINWTAVSLLGGPNDVSHMICLLSRLLKYSMVVAEDPGVALEEEIEHAKCYLELQDIRFAGRVTVDMRVRPFPKDLRVPKMILQPILENSFAHGLKDEDHPLKITVDVCEERCRRQGDGEDGAGRGRVAIVIADNGEGIDEETLKCLDSGSLEMPGGSSMVGLANIRKRILIFYKGDASFRISSAKMMGTEIRISVPSGMSPAQERLTPGS
jgi:two-component system, sensor histidine kinase YesM